MNGWTYFDSTGLVANRDLPNGMQESSLVSALPEGTVIAPYVAPHVNPDPVNPRQIRRALDQMGIRQAVEAAVAAGGQDLKDWYEYSPLFERMNPEVLAMAATLGVNDQTLDALWNLAASL